LSAQVPLKQPRSNWYVIIAVVVAACVGIVIGAGAAILILSHLISI
jgi:hypothetical protein